MDEGAARHGEFAPADEPAAVALTGRDRDAVTAARLLVRPPRKADRGRFIGLFCDEEFITSDGTWLAPM